ncbi:MAG: UDP-N-acetyl glucosamine 2-epimerase [Candidatus Aminicenantes bacterium]|nr:UDP-N-acetyl glucosamine 2-epimerase [Candidatus Aminicenantes bacterium]
MKIATIIGARPQFIKAAPVSRAIRGAGAEERRRTEGGGSGGKKGEKTGKPKKSAARARITEVLIHTGQHYDKNMSAVFFDEMGIPAPDYNLDIGSAAHGAQTGAMLAAIEQVLERERPDWVLIYGDTNSTLAGALAGAKMHIPIAHVEAGLRSYDRRMPEEINRVVADQLAAALFCPSKVAVANLRKEGIRDGVHVVGDVMAEALEYAVARAIEREAAQPEKFGLARYGIDEAGYILATVHRAENTDDPVRLKNILEALDVIGRIRPVVFPVHPRTQKMIARAGWKPKGRTARTAKTKAMPGGGDRPGEKKARSGGRAQELSPMRTGIRFIDPVGYLEMARLESGATMILTDSGGIQKEAYWLKVPCVTLRDRTEWVETVASGWNVLAGADKRKIVQAAENFTIPGKSESLYGRGSRATAPASRRIVEILAKSATRAK